MNRPILLISLSLAALVACNGGENPSGDGDTTSEGKANYQDAETEHDGSDREPASPPPQEDSDPMWVEIRVEGSATYSVSDPQCELDSLSGNFQGLYSGEAEISEDGLYVASLASTDATFETPSGCTVPELEIGALTDVVVRGMLSATQENCDSYCEAKARSEAEASCGADASSAECRASEEASYEASCTQTCSGSTTYSIVAESSLGASALTELNASALGAGALGSIEVDLVFDRIETEDEDEVDETAR